HALVLRFGGHMHIGREESRRLLVLAKRQQSENAPDGGESHGRLIGMFTHRERWCQAIGRSSAFGRPPCLSPRSRFHGNEAQNLPKPHSLQGSGSQNWDCCPTVWLLRSRGG